MRMIMKHYGTRREHRDDKILDGCAIFGMMNLDGKRFSPKTPLRAMSAMRERENGLGAGFAVYGLYPEHKQDYALHVMYLNRDAKQRAERLIWDRFEVLRSEELPTREANVPNPPLMWRYFVQPKRDDLDEKPADDLVLESVMRINIKAGGAFVISSGRDMAVFKGVGFPEDIAEYYCLEEYEGYMWVCHGRFPTNTPGWWAGAHPFSILDWAVVHNGELSSYGTNRRFLEMYGYRCTMRTDTEVLAYAFDFLVRRRGLPVEVASKVFAPPFWSEIEAMKPERRALLTVLRQAYGSLLMNGPFSVIVAHHGEMIGLTDRIKLRPLTAAVSGDFFFISSEEAAIRLVSPNLDVCWNPRGGEPVVGRLRSREIREARAGEKLPLARIPG
jgi:glutamate synthase domain-containing protein 1